MDDDLPKKPSASPYSLGQSLEGASVAELEALLKRLAEEAQRVDATLQERRKTALAAESFFKKT